MNKEKNLIILPYSEGFKVLTRENIIRIEAKRAYSLLKLNNGEQILISKSLKEMEEMVNNGSFFRTHQSHLVNVYHIRSYCKKDGGHLSLSNGDEIPLANGKKETLIQFLTQI